MVSASYTRAPVHNGLIALLCFQALRLLKASKVPKVTWTRRILHVSFVIETPVTIILIVTCTEWEHKSIDVLNLLIVGSRKFFEHTLDIVPIKGTNLREVDVVVMGG